MAEFGNIHSSAAELEIVRQAPDGLIAYEQQYNQCHALYEEGKDAECIQLGEHNLTDWGMSNYLRIKTFCLLAGASEDWHKAEVSQSVSEEERAFTNKTLKKYRITAESLYRSISAQVDEANLTPDDPTLQEDLEGLRDLRASLDSVCECQAENAPEDYSIEGGRLTTQTG